MKFAWITEIRLSFHMIEKIAGEAKILQILALKLKLPSRFSSEGCAVINPSIKSCFNGNQVVRMNSKVVKDKQSLQ